MARSMVGAEPLFEPMFKYFFYKIIIIASDNGSSPGRRRAIIWTNVDIIFIGPLGRNFSEISIEIPTFSFKKMHLKI